MSNEGNENTTSTEPPQPPKSLETVKNYLLQNKITAVLWLSRGLTICFFMSYLLPIFSPAASSYQKVLLCNAATSALRLHQRVTTVQLSWAFISQLFIEDSAHYLFYSIIFMHSTPITVVLLPVFLFAVLQFASFTMICLDMAGKNNALGARFFISIVEYHQRNILRIVALAEIFLMPFTVFLVFMGQIGLFTPFLYYRFLSMRYASRRNANTRNIFYELRVAMETIVNRPNIPLFLRNATLKAIMTISRMAPPVPQS